MKKVLMDLSKYLGVKGLRGVAHYYGVPESRIYSWTKKGRIANPGLILSRNPELSEEWVRTGKGPMLADKSIGRRGRRRMPRQDANIVNAEITEVVVTDSERAPEVSLPELINQVMAICSAGGEAKAILEAQVKALTQSLEKEREQRMLLAELGQIRATMDNMMAMLNQALPAAAKALMTGDENPEGADATDKNADSN
ncbi:MAG TPA: hypothetical protein DEB25_02525 [Desulfobulbaceae bacterium]|nr:hypothetical protein [Desulfobulbaceae bacterium]